MWRWRWAGFSPVSTPFFTLRPVGRRVPSFSGVFGALDGQQSLGKLCEEHGKTYVWASGQKATPDQSREEDSVQDGNFVPFVVPGLSSNSCTSSCSTSPPQDSSSTSSSPATERIHDGAQGNGCDTPKTQNNKKGRQRMEDRGLRNFPEWCEEFTDNLEDTEVPAPAHIFLTTQESERPTSGIEEAQYFYLLPERSKLRSMLAKQDDKGSLQKTHWRNSTSNRKSLVTCDQQITKSSMRKVNLETITDTIHRNLAARVKNFPGIIELLHLIDPRHMLFLKERCAEEKKERLLYCCNRARMKNGGLILWHAVAICEMFKTSWQTGKLFAKNDSENH